MHVKHKIIYLEIFFPISIILFYYPPTNITEKRLEANQHLYLCPKITDKHIQPNLKKWISVWRFKFLVIAVQLVFVQMLVKIYFCKSHSKVSIFDRKLNWIFWYIVWLLLSVWMSVWRSKFLVIAVQLVFVNLLVKIFLQKPFKNKNFRQNILLQFFI